MDIKTTQNGSVMELIVQGRLESTTAPQLDAKVKELPTGITELVMDLAGLEYTSSAGLRIILTAHKLLKSRGGVMKLRGVTPNVKKLLDMTAFTPFLTFV